MPRNGSNVYFKPAGTTAVPNTTIESAKYNQLLDDIAADLNLARPIVAGGTGATSKQAAVDSLHDGTTVIDDDKLRIADPVDRTKISRIDSGRITTATVRVMNAPDRDINISGVPRGHLFGLTLANNATDATNDIDIAAGEAADDSATPWCMVSSAITKRLDAAWAVGTGNGGLDTGSIANTTYHIWLIQRSDTGVVDALFSASATSPTMPTNYDRKRRIGSVVRESAALVSFVQIGRNRFNRAQKVDRTSTSAVASALLALSVPTGVPVRPIFMLSLGIFGASNITNAIGSASSGSANIVIQQTTSPAGASLVDVVNVDGLIQTNTSAQIYFAASVLAGSISGNTLTTLGWIDDGI